MAASRFRASAQVYGAVALLGIARRTDVKRFRKHYLQWQELSDGAIGEFLQEVERAQDGPIGEVTFEKRTYRGGGAIYALSRIVRAIRSEYGISQDEAIRAVLCGQPPRFQPSATISGRGPFARVVISAPVFMTAEECSRLYINKRAACGPVPRFSDSVAKMAKYFCHYLAVGMSLTEIAQEWAEQTGASMEGARAQVSRALSQLGVRATERRRRAKWK